jgi:hypothetical protein
VEVHQLMKSILPAAKEVIEPYDVDVGPREFISSLHAAFSDFKWEMQKLIPDDDGEGIIAGRTQWSGTP